MSFSFKKIVFIISIIILLPLIVYTVYEINGLSEREKIIENIYSEQLNTIIFSVNQYAEDVLQSWAGKISNIYLNQNNIQHELEFKKLLKENPSMLIVVISNTTFSNNIQFYTKKGYSSSESAIKKMQNILINNAEPINELKELYKIGYKKIHTLSNQLDDTPLLSFIIKDRNGETKIAIMAINIEDFINNILIKRINPISGSDLTVSIFHNEDLVLNSSGNNVLFEELIESKNLWNFPNYFLGISTSHASISDIVKERSTINIVILIILNMLIISGLGFVFYNIRKEIKLSQLKSDFVSNVSHELRTPLSLIGMFAETLEMHRTNSEEEKDEYYRIIRKETERLTHIVNSILNFSRMESETKKYNFDIVNLNEIIDEVLKTYKYELKNGKNKYSVNKFDPVPNLNLDKEAITEAIINLIDNALKYCESNCNIEISTGINGHFVYVEVSDNGIGISKDDQKRIFEKFYRVSSGNVHNTKGSGLGLTLVKNIMVAHGGHVKVESKLGSGSKFTLQFPIK